MTFHSYTIGQELGQPEDVRSSGPQVHVHDTVTQVSSVDGVVSETSQSYTRAKPSELNPYHGTESALATAQNPNGLPVTQILPTTLVTIDGVQAPVSFWVKQGRLQQAADGTFAEGSSQPVEQAQADQGDYLPISDAGMAQVNQALESVDQASLDSLASVGTGVVIGRLDPAALERKFTEVSGYGGEEGSARLQTIMGVYQAQADEAVTRLGGIDQADLPAFYQWAKTTQQGRLQEALHKQLHMHDVSGYKALAAQFMTANAPSLEAFKAAGVPVRSQGGKPEVYLRGSWMSPGAAAKAGLV